MQTIAHYVQHESLDCLDAKDASFSLQRALEAIGAPLGDDLGDIFRKYCLRRIEKRIFRLDEQEVYRRLLFEDEAFRFGNKLSEYLSLIQIVTGNEAPNIAADLQIVERFRRELNLQLLQVHPGHAPMNVKRITSRFKGHRVKIAVVDVFDTEKLQMQRACFSDAILHDVESFGRPVSLDHGNSVIDFILGLAPGAEIFPISSDGESSARALASLMSRDDISIVNISRPLKRGADGGVDPEFRNIFEELVRSKIVVKALGNSGTDLAGNVSSARNALGLGPTADLSAYDGALIAEILNDLNGDHLVLAQNWKFDASSVALSATVVGQNEAARSRTIGAPADGVFSFSSSNFESGSSFAAPQISAIVALLLEAQTSHCGSIDLSQIILSIKTNEKLIDADGALDSLLRGGCS